MVSSSVSAAVVDDVGFLGDGPRGLGELADGCVDRDGDVRCPKFGFSDTHGLDRALILGLAPTLEAFACLGDCLGFALDWGFTKAC